MLKKLDTGIVVSGIGHLVLIGWALIGGLIYWDSPQETVTSVSMISSEDYAALVASVPDPNATATPGPEVPDAPEAPAAPDVAEPQTPQPPAPESQPETSSAPPPAAEARPDAAPDTSALEPLPQADVTQTAPETPTPPAPASDENPGASLVLDNARRPKERPANRVAPTPSAPPEPDAAVDTEVTQAAEPVPAQQDPAPAEPKEATAPEAANTEIVTEAETPTGGDVVALAPTGSPRPRARPARREPAAEPARAETSTDTSDAIADAVADAVSQGQAPSEPARSAPARGGPPMTAGEKDALRVSVQQCWNVGSLSSEALRVTVTVLVQMNENATPDNGSIRMIGSEGGSGDAVRQAFEAARRAIIRCGARGFPLPAEKYGEWAEIEMVFNPEKMRIK